MRIWIITIFFVCGLALQVNAQSKDIPAVISEQLQAFQKDDIARAFTFAAPNIRQMFRTPEIFGTMVQRGYPMVWRPAEFSFLALEQRDGMFVQTVRITDTAGKSHDLAYLMVETEAGWKIAGVQVLDPPDFTT